MTICIGALCSYPNVHPSKALVIASDRMVTFGGITQFEHEVSKIIEVTDKIVIMTAGDALKGSRLARDIMTHIPAGSPTVKGVADASALRYTELRKEQIEAQIFTPRGISMQDFYQGLQQRILPQLVGAIDDQVATFDYTLDLLIAGVDEAGAHLYSVVNPGGSISDFAPIGYHAVGSGALHALQSMIGFKHMGARELPETLLTVYASKRRAEIAPGVGADTDIAIIHNGGITYIDKAVLTQLEALYAEFQRPITDEMRTKLDGLELIGKEEKKNAAKR